MTARSPHYDAIDGQFRLVRFPSMWVAPTTRRRANSQGQKPLLQHSATTFRDRRGRGAIGPAEPRSPPGGALKKGGARTTKGRGLESLGMKKFYKVISARGSSYA